MVNQVLQSKPENATRSMSQVTGISPASVMRIWRTLFGLKPHLEKTFKLSTDPLFVDKVHDIVELYLNPPDKALVLCVDDKEPDSGTQPHPAGITSGTWQPCHSHSRLQGTSSTFA